PVSRPREHQVVEVEVGSPAGVGAAVNAEERGQRRSRSARFHEPAFDFCAVDAREAQRYDGRQVELCEQIVVEPGEAALFSRTRVDEVEVARLREPERGEEDSLAPSGEWIAD